MRVMWRRVLVAIVAVLHLATPVRAHGDHETPRCPFPQLSPRSGPVKVRKFIRCMAESLGLDPGKAVDVAECESGLDPRAYNKPYGGVYQQDEDEWDRRSRFFGFPGHSIFDPRANVTVSLRAIKGGGYEAWGCA